MTIFLEDLETLEVSLVNKAANARKFLIFKSDSETEEKGMSNENIEAKEEAKEAETAAPESTESTESKEAPVEESKEAPKEIPAEAPSEAPVEEAPKEAAESSDESITKSDGSIDFAKVPANLRGALETIYKGQQEAIAKAKEYEARLAKELDEKETKAFIEKAAEYKNLNTAPERLGLILKEASKKLSSANFAELEKILKTANSGSEAIYKELGTKQANDNGNEPMSVMNSKAQAIAKAENINFYEAFAKVVDSEPELFKSRNVK